VYKIQKNGMIFKGTEEGTVNSVRKKFIDDGYLVLNLKEVRNKSKKENENKKKKTGFFAFIESLLSIRKRVGSRKLAEFSSQFYILVDAGLTITEAIRILAKNEMDKSFKAILKDLECEIHQGTSLSEAISNKGDVFPPVFKLLVKTGEYSGEISSVFRELADYFDKIDDNKSKIIGVCIYPAVLVVFLLANMIVMSIKVIPIFREIFGEFQEKLPLNTRIIFFVADLIRNYYLILIFLVAASPFILIAALRTKTGKKVVDKTIILIPVVGKLVIDSSVNTFLKSLTLTLKSGMTIIEALGPSIGSMGNYIVRESIQKDVQAIIEGKPLHELLKNNKYIRDIAKTLIETGENSAKIETTLDKAIYYYNVEIAKRIDRVNRLIEPTLIIFFGFVVGFVVISLAIPMFKISSGAFVK
jgi:type IV pilus assembly protein PilC